MRRLLRMTADGVCPVRSYDWRARSASRASGDYAVRVVTISVAIIAPKKTTRKTTA
jgi:hypothetical protein